MAHKLRRKSVSSTLEKRILTSLIVSTRFNYEVAPLINQDYFTNSFIRKVVNWCIDFFNAYEKAPFNHIQDIFEEHRNNLSEEEAELIEKILLDISKKYELDSGLNVDYSIQQALDYFKRRELEITHGNIGLLLEKNDIDGAEDQINTYTKVSRLTSGWINPFDEEHIDEVFAKSGRMFNFPGELGNFFSGIDRGWLVAIVAPFKKGKCLHGDSLIALPNGVLKPIKDIVRDKDKEIVSLNKDGKFVKSKIIEHYINGVKPVYRLKTRLGYSVDATYEHPFLTLDGWKQLKDLKINDAIATPRNIPFFGDTTVDEYKLKFLAYMLADGCFGSNRYTKSNKEMQNDFKYCVEMFGDTCIHVTYNELDMRIKLRKPNKQYNSLKWLDSINVNRCKSKYKTIPDLIFTLDKKCLSTFISYLFSGDGSIFKNKKTNSVNIEYVSASKKMILQIRQLLLRFGIVSAYRKKIVTLNGKKFDSWNLTIRNKENLLKFINEIGFHFYKQEKVIKWLPLIKDRTDNRNLQDLFYGVGEKVLNILNQHSYCKEKDLVKAAIKNNSGITRNVLKRIYKRTNDKWIKSLVDSDILWDKVTSIESMGEDETYDLTVEDTHCFVANNIIVHNSAALQEITVPAILNGLKVVHFSLEMGKKESNDRLYKRMMGAGSPEGGPALYPCFDCTKNQDGTCKRKERANRIKLIGADGKPKFTQNLKYKPCTACRFENPTEYDVAWWYELIDRPAYTIENVKKNIAAINRVLNNRYRFKAYPKFSATLDDMKRDLDILERSEGFVPDIIEIDQANGIRPDQGVSTDGIAPHLSAWRGMASLAGERHAMVVSPSQVVRSALDKKSVKQNEVAQWVGLLGDIDIGYSLNQTEDEKREGIMRYNILIHRHDDFDPSASCIVLQKLRFGQAYLDGYIIGKSNYDNTNSITL